MYADAMQVSQASSKGDSGNSLLKSCQDTLPKVSYSYKTCILTCMYADAIQVSQASSEGDSGNPLPKSCQDTLPKVSYPYTCLLAASLIS